jgi:hypothetical protein
MAVVLGGLITLAVLEPGKEDTPSKVTLTQLTPDQIQHIRLMSPGHPAVDLEKTNSHWQMLAPFSISANQERIAQLLKILSTQSLANYPIDQVDTQQLQLDTPSLTLIVNDTRMDFGGMAALGNSRYLRIGDSVHLITDRYSHLARGPATDLVSPSLLGADDNIIALHLPSLDLSLQDGQWQLENHHATSQQNPDHLQELLDEWRHTRAFNVQPLDKTALGNEIIEIRTANSLLRFTLLRTADEIILQRQDLGLQYHFSQEVGQRLLSLPPPNDA